MAFDPNLNQGGACNSLNSEENCLDYPLWCDNEESLDLSSFMSNSRNLELCNDDLFQNLFPPNSPNNADDVKKKEVDHLDDSELEGWFNNSMIDSACTSACSSAATSPIPQTYYNTPPVTPRAERYRTASPHHLQYDNITASMSSSKFASLRNDKSNSARQEPDMHAHNRIQPIAVKAERVSVDNVNGSTSFGFIKPNTNSANTSHAPQNTSTSFDIQKEQPGDFQLNHAKALLSKRARERPSHSSSLKKVKAIEKGTAEYFEKRNRNNVAVRRSRDKAKIKAKEMQRKVDELTNENVALRKKVAELDHELNTFKNILTSLPQASSCLRKL